MGSEPRRNSALDWVYESTTRRAYWWACRLCGGMGREGREQVRVEGLLARHLREYHGCPVLVRLAARAVSLKIEVAK